MTGTAAGTAADRPDTTVPHPAVPLIPPPPFIPPLPLPFPEPEPAGWARGSSATALLPPEPGAPWADDPYAHALRTGRGPLYLRRLSRDAEEERLLFLDVERWCAAPDAADTSVLHRCTGPVLDVGCGPGRLVGALAARGLPALGVDVSPAAVSRTRRLGGAALRRSVFDRLPREGRWSTVLLMDGNIGIGGDPAALLVRLGELACPGGRLLVEAAAPDVDERLTVRVEDGHGRHGRPFPWARVGTTALARAADTAGWILTGRWTAAGRPFMEFHRPRPRHPAPDGESDQS
ncbi:methyltransferase domain-containing protein [Streptomyces sp. NPDC052040]|uniref:methyltransferase domain-containing protein n=1 Tax=Streptomyces sp. NPDC052040 TaxID=3365682 RepID=UPI0037D13384